MESGFPNSLGQYGARYIVASCSTSPSRTRSSHPTRPRTFLLIDASAKKYTVENRRHAENRNLDLVPERFKAAVRRPEALQGRVRRVQTEGLCQFVPKMQNVAPVSMLAARRTLFSPAFKTTGTEIPSRSLP